MKMELVGIVVPISIYCEGSRRAIGPLVEKRKATGLSSTRATRYSCRQGRVRKMRYARGTDPGWMSCVYEANTKLQFVGVDDL